LIILKNLVSNALKYSPPDSLVELLIRPAHQNIGAGLLFSISNEVGAAGLPDPARMFERYYRGEGALSQSGAGLGLWLAQEMAGNLGTVIEAQMSEHKISFSFFLPLNPVSA
jgi:signal transduction histidine kinase